MTEEIIQTIQQISEKVNDMYTMIGGILIIGVAWFIIFFVRYLISELEKEKRREQQEREQLKKDIQEAIQESKNVD